MAAVIGRVAVGVTVARTVAIVHARQIAVAGAVAVAVRTIVRTVIGSHGGAIAIAVIGGRDDRVFTVGRIRREGARTGIGRALVHVIILRGRLGETLIGAVAVTVSITAAAGVATGIDRRNRLAWIEAAGRGGRGRGGRGRSLISGARITGGGLTGTSICGGSGADEAPQLS